MKEFTSDTGGRFTYIDDFLNLQELALAISQIFDNCDHFIVSGCEVQGKSITEGLVYLGGKLRVFPGASDITTWPQYIYESNTHESVSYASGGEKAGRKVYGVKVGASVPITNDAITGARPRSIQITKETGGLRMNDAWFGKYALLLNPSASSQSVKGTVNFKDVVVEGQVNTLSRYKINTPGGFGTLYYSGKNMILESISGGHTIRMEMDGDANTIAFEINGKAIGTISSAGVVFSEPITVSRINVGNMRVTGSSIYNASTDSDDGQLDINVYGYNGGNTRYRKTRIGNGRGSIVMTVSNNKVDMTGRLTISGSEEAPIVFKANVPKTNVALKRWVCWHDSASEIMATLGYTDGTNTNMYFTNRIGDIGIHVSEGNYVNIGPAIKENGTLLSDKYASKSGTTTSLSLKANAADVYKKTEVYTQAQANAKFATIAGGLTQFVDHPYTADALCSQIGAAKASDLNNYLKKDQFLADIATTEAYKAKIRQNIGAAAASSAHTDTGWVKISDTNLYARQIGNIVSIQGVVSTIHSGTVFTLPNNISSPKYAVGYDAPMTDGCYWSCQILGGGRTCTVTRCNHHNMNVAFSLTYMI